MGSECYSTWVSLSVCLLCHVSPMELYLLDTQRSTREYPTILNNIQPCPKQCLLMPLAHIRARADSLRITPTTQSMANLLARTLDLTKDMQYAPSLSLARPSRKERESGYRRVVAIKFSLFDFLQDPQVVVK